MASGPRHVHHGHGRGGKPPDCLPRFDPRPQPRSRSAAAATCCVACAASAARDDRVRHLARSVRRREREGPAGRSGPPTMDASLGRTPAWQEKFVGSELPSRSAASSRRTRLRRRAVQSHGRRHEHYYHPTRVHRTFLALTEMWHRARNGGGWALRGSGRRSARSWVGGLLHLRPGLARPPLNDLHRLFA